MNCPLCGEEVKLERNLKVHQKGQVCKGFVFERKMIAEGWRPIPAQYQKWVKDAGIEFIVGPKMYIGGWTQRVIHIRRMHWVRESVAQIIDRRIGKMSFVGPVAKAPIPEVKALLHRYAQEHPRMGMGT